MVEGAGGDQPASTLVLDIPRSHFVGYPCTLKTLINTSPFYHVATLILMALDEKYIGGAHLQTSANTFCSTKSPDGRDKYTIVVEVLHNQPETGADPLTHENFSKNFWGYRLWILIYAQDIDHSTFVASWRAMRKKAASSELASRFNPRAATPFMPRQMSEITSDSDCILALAPLITNVDVNDMEEFNLDRIDIFDILSPEETLESRSCGERISTRQVTLATYMNRSGDFHSSYPSHADRFFALKSGCPIKDFLSLPLPNQELIALREYSKKQFDLKRKANDLMKDYRVTGDQVTLHKIERLETEWELIAEKVKTALIQLAYNQHAGAELLNKDEMSMIEKSMYERNPFIQGNRYSSNAAARLVYDPTIPTSRADENYRLLEERLRDFSLLFGTSFKLPTVFMKIRGALHHEIKREYKIAVKVPVHINMSFYGSMRSQFLFAIELLGLNTYHMFFDMCQTTMDTAGEQGFKKLKANIILYGPAGCGKSTLLMLLEIIYRYLISSQTRHTAAALFYHMLEDPFTGNCTISHETPPSFFEADKPSKGGNSDSADHQVQEKNSRTECYVVDSRVVVSGVNGEKITETVAIPTMGSDIKATNSPPPPQHEASPLLTRFLVVTTPIQDRYGPKVTSVPDEKDPAVTELFQEERAISYFLRILEAAVYHLGPCIGVSTDGAEIAFKRVFENFPFATPDQRLKEQLFRAMIAKCARYAVIAESKSPRAAKYTSSPEPDDGNECSFAFLLECFKYLWVTEETVYDVLALYAPAYLPIDHHRIVKSLYEKKSPLLLENLADFEKPTHFSSTGSVNNPKNTRYDYFGISGYSLGHVAKELSLMVSPTNSRGGDKTAYTVDAVIRFIKELTVLSLSSPRYAYSRSPKNSRAENHVQQDTSMNTEAIKLPKDNDDDTNDFSSFPVILKPSSKKRKVENDDDNDDDDDDDKDIPHVHPSTPANPQPVDKQCDVCKKPYSIPYPRKPCVGCGTQGHYESCMVKCSDCSGYIHRECAEKCEEGKCHAILCSRCKYNTHVDLLPLDEAGTPKFLAKISTTSDMRDPNRGGRTTVWFLIHFLNKNPLDALVDAIKRAASYNTQVQRTFFLPVPMVIDNVKKYTEEHFANRKSPKEAFVCPFFSIKDAVADMLKLSDKPKEVDARTKNYVHSIERESATLYGITTTVIVEPDPKNRVLIEAGGVDSVLKPLYFPKGSATTKKQWLKGIDLNTYALQCHLQRYFPSHVPAIEKSVMETHPMAIYLQTIKTMVSNPLWMATANPHIKLNDPCNYPEDPTFEYMKKVLVTDKTREEDYDKDPAGLDFSGFYKSTSPGDILERCADPKTKHEEVVNMLKNFFDESEKDTAAHTNNNNSVLNFILKTDAIQLGG
jgi:energy-coupling factor transporter ATP-binding protein EcfA2